MPNGKNEKLTPNQKVLTWARGMAGKKIGRGTCWDLGEAALKGAGAQTSNDLGPVGDDTDYVWGDPIPDLKDVQPGDILQIRDHVVTTVTTKHIVFADGSTLDITDEREAKRGHHTAIVNEAPTSDGRIATLEQHVKPRGDVVQHLVLVTRGQPATKKITHEMHKHPRTKKAEKATVTTTTKINVEGTIWAYRPKPK